ncbi:LysR family transcriptional regulator [Moritella sp. Urea-trap-13]|uniref:LysR family transcriptional regulator n=1 Tax=Moritella sp. Urea-trap-13 TaxID=2058327 RepID=UPI000C345BD8|nr:LysR family transcriptional regulator [Moritella sp. Urea-trap-13]PKH07502.1 LysR family transcriptional regulator [Moritella sp. Urea-trap-13]
MDQLRALKYFVKVVEHGSFSKAAELFSVPPSSLSRRVADLEKSLGATLLKRTTRAVSLTEIGQIYYQQVNEVLSLLAHSDETVRNYQSTPMGVLNISSMVGFGERILLPLLDEFRALYPQITLNVSLSDDLSTLGRDEVDLAIRGGYAPDERVLAIKLMDNNFIAVAAPSYLETYGVPVNAMELKQHKGLYFKAPNGPTPWICEIDNQWHDVSAERVLISNNGKWLVEKAVAGLGILLMPRWALKPYIESGALTELTITPSINITQQANLGVFLLYQKQRYQVPKIKAAVDFLVERVKGVY